MYIEALEEEAKRIPDLKSEVSERIEGGVITGSGDSFAACLALEGKSLGRFRCVDPYDLLDWNPPNTLIIVSVSAKPKVYLALVEKLRGKSEIVLVTASENSKLLNLVDRVVKVPYQPAQTLPGTLSFVATLKTLYSLAGIWEEPERGKPMKLGRSPFFVGRGENYGVAYFAYLKMAEIFGEISNAERLEQFLHSPVFSSGGRRVVFLSSGDWREKTIENYNYENFLFSPCKSSLCNAETVVLSIIEEMKQRNWDKIWFLENKNILKFSSDMIY
ncbi:hypothetical protein GWK48_09360 [Metallosphaera tengchongensis]|uniref:SIS domain-containing protein n=1 Tax=Metallosphaera tengchongensis TaxID=1532350 RepID=A0A6N0NYW3_9CREN|nr:hypothetical protein [Metallosphaera tengchongensis]QKR00558.1 hypothetical protein GWK48_09360 [Metallosphaera tengchongensis]